MKKNKTIWFFIIWFVWAIGKDIELLYRHQTTSDYFSYNNLGITPIFFILAVAVLVLNIGSLFFLIKPKLIGIKITFGAFITASIYNLTTSILGLSDTSGMKQAYMVSRETRGLNSHEEIMSVAFSLPFTLIAMALVLIFYGLMAYFIYKNKAYYK